MGSHLYGSSNVGLGLSEVSSQISSLHDQNQAPSNLLRLGGSGGFNHLITPSNASAFRPPQASPSSAFFLGGSAQDLQESQSTHHSLLQNKSFNGLMQLPDLQQNTAAPGSSSAVSSAAANLFNLSFFSNSSSTSSINNSNSDGNQNSHLLISDQFSNSNASAHEPAPFFAGNLMSDHVGSGVSSLYNSTVQSESLLPQMSATALLQKAAQMGSSTSSNGSSSLLRGFGNSSNSPSSAKAINFRGCFGSGGGGERTRLVQAENEAHLQDLMDSLANGSAGIFGGGGSTRVSAFGGGHEQGAAFGAFDPSLCNMDEAKLHHSLSMGSIGGSDGLTRDFLGVGGMVRSLGSAGVSQREQHTGRLDHISSLESDSASRSFAGGNLQ